MNDFTTDLKAWEKAYFLNKEQYGNKIWEGIGHHPLDILFLQLINLYLLADVKQKKNIENIFLDQATNSWQLVIFLRRLGKLIETTKDEKLLEAGLVAGTILFDKEDPRDLSVSIALFKFGADRAGLDLIKYAKKATNHPPALLKTIEAIYGSPEESVTWTIKHFGPNEWIDKLVDIK